MQQFHSAFQTLNEMITDLLLMPTTMQGHQITSLSTASALKPTVSGSAIVFLVKRAFSSCDRNRFVDQQCWTTCLMTLQVIQSGVQCPSVILGASLCMC